MAQLEELVQIVKAAGDITRLRLLALLADGELSVKDLTDILNQSQPRVSRHLKLLADAGLVERHAEGAWAYYRLTDTGETAEFGRRLVGQISLHDEQRVADQAALSLVRNMQQAQAAAYFSQVAESWDALRNLHVPEASVEAAIVAAVGRDTVGMLLDLGTGTGRMLELLSGQYRQGVGIDSSREMLGVARAKLAGPTFSHAQVRLGDISSLEVGAMSADLVVIHQVLHYFDDPGQILAQAEQALSTNGQVLIVDFAPHKLEFLRAEHAHRRLGLSSLQMAAWASFTGLKISTHHEFPSESGANGLTVSLWVLTKTDLVQNQTTEVRNR